ncbi:MAG: 16S rRNA (cytosine(967)-C(5))-methyltransferase RsmB [Oscillospiraceae bacterium]|nr:16S rRNA (cytosine(967)-C(5))-methyltransferase RsmB [Oscillospiraceae bacterium]
MSARKTALKALLRVDENSGYSNLVLDKALRSCQLSERDRSFAAALFYGVLERRLTLDAVLEQYTARPKRKVDTTVWEILRMAAYQIFYMDKIPDSAAVNEAVILTKQSGKGKASGFVNGILRNLLRSRGTVEFPPQHGSRLHRLSVQYSCPEWLISMWESAYGKDITLKIMENCFLRPPLYARVNTLKINREKLMDLLHQESIKASPVLWLEDALKLDNTGSIAQSKCFQHGLFHIQDLASQLCCKLFGAKPGERIYDVCAAPGGKTFTIAQRMHDDGEIRSFDQYKGKVCLIQKGAQRLGIHCISAALRDAAAGSDPLPPADRVLCDVPCSGLGILRRKPEIRYKSPESIDSLPILQYRILCRSADLLRPGGVLLYSTCTLNPAENQANTQRFLSEHPIFAALPLHLPKGIQRTIKEPENQLTLFPQTNQTDGFFISAFRREESFNHAGYQIHDTGRTERGL